MAINNSNFSVGGVPLDRSKFNPESFGKMAEAAAGVPIEENKPAGEWKDLAERIAKQDEVTSDDLAAFQDLNKAARPERSKLRKAFAKSGYKDEKIASKLTQFYVFDGPFGKLTEALRLGSAKVAVEALANSGFGPLNVVTAYQAYSNLAQAPLQELVTSIEGVEAGKAKNYFPGNEVKQFHHERIWQEMNQMMSDSLQSAKDGKPVQITAQYYELTSPDLLGKLAANVEAGNPVRVNVDAGRIVAYSGDRIELDDFPDKMRSILQLTQLKGDIGVSTYPVSKLLGDPNDLMHRKGLSCGETFLLSGMNANAGSGENIDAGYTIQGPAARQLVQNFKRDVKESRGVTNADVFGEKSIAEFADKEVLMGSRGIVSLLDALHGPSPAGTPLERPKDFAELSAYAKSRDFDIKQLFQVPDGELEAAVNGMLQGGEPLPVTAFTKGKVLELSEKALDATRSEKNLKALDDINLPKGEPQGKAVVAIADLPTERETEMIMTIQQAEKFIYVPAFVMTRPIAAALVAKNNEMKAQGKPFDVRVVADPGIYPDGGTPNEDGIRLLEDGGIRARWALLPRCGSHDRKIHAKELLTDKSELFGSTNFSKKGLRENWEHSGIVHFDEKDPDSIKQRDEAKAVYEDLWDNFSYECNTIDLATVWKTNYEGPDKEYQIEDARFGVVKKILKGIDEWEVESGAWTEQQAKAPVVQARVGELIASGIDEMSAVHLAVRQTLGDEKYFAGLHGLKSYGELKKLAPHRHAS